MGRKRRRGKAERFILFPEYVLVHRDWRAAPVGALPVLIDICKRWNGQTPFNNNGRIGYGVRSASGIGVSKDKTAAILRWLEEHGWLAGNDEYRPLFFADGRRRQREWRITFFPTFGAVPTRRESQSDERPSVPGRHLRLDHYLLDCPAYRHASTAARTILIELLRRFDGGNNGLITFGGKEGLRVGIWGCSAGAEPHGPSARRPVAGLVYDAPRNPSKIGPLWRNHAGHPFECLGGTRPALGSSCSHIESLARCDLNAGSASGCRLDNKSLRCP